MKTVLNRVPSGYDHRLYAVETFASEGGYGGGYTSRYPVGFSLDNTYDSTANVVSSELMYEGMHSIALDIDLPASLVPSSTPGHWHLYIDKAMTWRKYKKILRALKNAGVIEKGYYGASVARRATYLRLPGVKKKGRS